MDGRPLGLAAALAALALFPGSALADPGELTQLSGTAGCHSESGGSCTAAPGLAGASSVAVSRDGKNVYAVSENGDAIVVFSRNETTGALTRLPGTQGCVSEDGSDGVCADGKALVNPHSIAFSDDPGASENVYVGTRGSNSITVFSRDTNTGALTQLSGTDGCVSQNGTGGECTAVSTLNSGFASLAVDTVANRVYAAAFASDAVTVFARNATTGALTRLSGTAGCVAETATPANGCADGRALDGPRGILSRVGLVLVVSGLSDAVASFDRDLNTGVLTQPSGTAGCISDTGSSGACHDGVGLEAANSLELVPPGNVYTTSEVHGIVARIHVDAGSGALTQSGDSGDCVADDGFGICEDAIALAGAMAVDVTPTAEHAYVAARVNHAISNFDREPGPVGSGGALTQLSGTAGCITAGAGNPGCTTGTGFQNIRDVVVAPGGKHVYAAAFNTGVAIFSRELDTTPPNTTISSGPAEGSATNDKTPTFTFTSNEEGSDTLGPFQCKVDTIVTQGCPATFTVGPAVQDGPHTLTVAARDQAGNLDPTPAVRNFTVDTVAPDTTISPDIFWTNDNTPTWTFSSEPGSTFQCKLDSGSFAACSSPYTAPALPDGPHSLEVRATDPAGNVEPFHPFDLFGVDTVPPGTFIVSGPASLGFSGPTATFTFTSTQTQSTFECRMDGLPFAPCTSPKTYTGLAPGQHTFQVRAVDLAGNKATSAATRTFTVLAFQLPQPITFVGTSKANVFKGGAAGDKLSGLGGNDVLCGEGGSDSVLGGNGNDKLFGDACPGITAAQAGAPGNDRLVGGAGNDRLSGGAGKDSLTGGAGKDRLSGGPGKDKINAVDGRREKISCGGGRDRLRADPSDRARGCERVIRVG